MFNGLKCRPLIYLIILGVIILAGCTDQEQAKKVDLSERRDISVRNAKTALTYAYLPQYSHKASYQRHHLLVDYLAQSTGLTIRQIFPDTFDEHINMVGRDLIDISFVNPFIYVQLSDRFGSKSLVRVVEPSGQLNFRGQIICRADNSHIHSLKDLKGKRLIAVDPSSAGGYLFPWGLMLEQGLRQQDFTEISFAPGPGGKQEKVVLAVYSGKYDVAKLILKK
jgi:phosphonate transport system substrate-binding protein